MIEKTKLRFLEPKNKIGLIIVITGHGKGKTTSALGTVLRAIGYGMRVCIIQFIKGDIFSGEIDGLRKLASEVELHLTGKGYCRLGTKHLSHHEHRAEAQAAFSLAKEKMLSGDFDLLILDEINNAVSLGLVDLSQVVEMIKNKPPLLHCILTGRDAHPEIINLAHTVTEMREIKHAYGAGIEPQPGIDY